MTGDAMTIKRRTWSGKPAATDFRWKAWIAVGIGSAILGQAMIYRHAAPFVVVFSLIVWQRQRQWYAPFMLGGLVGTTFGVGWLPALVLLVWALLVPFPWHRAGWQFLKWPLLGLGAAAVFGVGHRWNDYFLAIVALVVAGSIILFYFLSRELELLIKGEVERSTLILLLASLGCLIAGLAGYQIFEVNPSLLIGGLVMLAASAIQGPAGGAVAGATLGVTLALRGGATSNLVGTMVAGGFVAGWLANRHWRLGSLGLVVGTLIYAIFIQLPHPLEPFWVSVVASAALFQAIPDAFVDMARQWTAILSGPNSRDMLGERMGRIADVMKEMARAFKVEEEDRASETEFVQSVVDSVCKKCSFYRSCWEDEFYRSYRGLLDLSAKAEDQVVRGDDLSGDLARRCIRPDEVAHATNLAMNRQKERQQFAIRIQESRALAQMQLTGLAQLVQEMAHDVQQDVGPRRRKWRVQVLPYRVGVAKRPRRGGVVSGDSELIAELSATRAVFGISDGMGVGPRAAWESGTAMSLLEQLLRAGFTHRLAVRAVNSTLLLRSSDDHFATLDLCLLDRELHQIEMVKIAASPTFIKRGGSVFVVKSHSLPVGILQDVSVEAVVYPVQEGDVIVMATDGVMDVDQPLGEARMQQFLQKLPWSDAQIMAETILSFMLGEDGDGRDDALVMVVTLGSPSVSTGPSAETPVHEWRRVTASSSHR